MWTCKENLYKHFLVSQRSPNTITHEDMLGNSKTNLIYSSHMSFIYYCGIRVCKKKSVSPNPILLIENIIEVKEKTKLKAA